ncbi:MAG: 2'-5' RNA ligase family protein [Cytophagales bacterium]|nr:2'-5' RNA ligase family protein [Cytophaga sp.]
MIPDESILNEIWAMKLQCTEKYQTRTALRSPPHLTLLPPFHYNESEEKTLYEQLANSCNGILPFRIQLNGYNTFPSKVLYVQPVFNPILSSLQKSVEETFYKEYQPFAQKIFHPHITIAFRDWDQALFEQAAKAYSDKHYDALWKVCNVSVLKHNGKEWQEIYQYRLPGPNKESDNALSR